MEDIEAEKIQGLQKSENSGKMEPIPSSPRLSLAQLLAAKKQKPLPPKVEILRVEVSDSLVAEAFFLAVRIKYSWEIPEIFNFFDIPYTPHICKAESEHPSQEIIKAILNYYLSKNEAANSLNLTDAMVRGIGRVLTDHQQQLLISILERSTHDR